MRSVNPDHPDTDVIQAAAATIRSGGVVIFPTSGLYGMGADIFNPAAVMRVFDIKGRAMSKPLLALISHEKMLSRIVATVPPLGRFFMDRFWPGKMTLVMPGGDHLPRGMRSRDDNVGVRLVKHPVAAALVDAVGGPVTGTSANLSGAAGCTDPATLAQDLVAMVDDLLDAGRLVNGAGSTVVDVCGASPVILREGCIDSPTVAEAFDQYRRQQVDMTG